MSVLEGVILVVTASVNVIEDGDTYNSLLECGNILNGEFFKNVLSINSPCFIVIRINDLISIVLF